MHYKITLPNLSSVKSLINLKSFVVLGSLLFTFHVSAISEEAKAQGLPSLAPMLEGVTPSVVSIRVAKTLPTSSRYFYNGDELPEELRRYFPRAPQSEEDYTRPYAAGAGSGVIVDGDQGLIVTNHHVVDNAATITVQLHDRRIVQAELLGSDPNTDIALLRVQADGLTDIQFADADTVAVGDYVVAIGNPFGIGQTVTSGIVSALGRSGLNRNNYEDFIQTDAAINMGNSGGALVDLEGNLIGINTAIISGSGGSNGIGFAVPVDMVSSVLAHLERDGEVRRGLLGVSIVDLTPQVAESLDLDLDAGAVITSVMDDSAAEAAGIQLSDVIVELDGKPIGSSRDLRNTVGLMSRGEEVSLRLYRGGRSMTLDAVIGGAEGTVLTDENAQARDGSFRGAELRSAQTGDSAFTETGVFIVSIHPGSPVATAGLQNGDVIVEVNRRSVDDLQQFNEVVGDSERLTAITVWREGRRLLLFVP